jgi:hypothetical protein
MTELIRENSISGFQGPESREAKLALLAAVQDSDGTFDAPTRDKNDSQNQQTPKEVVCDQTVISGQKPANPEDLDPDCRDLPNLLPEQPFDPIAAKPIVVSDKDFDNLGADVAKALRDGGVERFSVQVGRGSDHLGVDLKKPLDITPDPPSQNVRKIEIAERLDVDVHREKDGSVYMDNIRGLSAIVNVLGAWQNVPITRVVLTPTADGRTRITVTGQVGLFSQTQSSVKDGDVLKKADALMDKIDEIKKRGKP